MKKITNRYFLINGNVLLWKIRNGSELLFTKVTAMVTVIFIESNRIAIESY